MSDIIISGYYGLGNSGDEALLKSIINDLKSVCPNVSITVLSANAYLTKSLYGVKTANRFNPFAVIKELKSAKLLLSGGGTLIQDATSTKSLMYYLGIISLAKKMGLKVMLYANGMGPIKDKNVAAVGRILNKVELITLRENVSLEEIKRCNITKPRIAVTADPAFNLKASDKKRSMEILSKYSVDKNKNLIAVSVRETARLTPGFEEEMAAALDRLADMGYMPVFIPMQIKFDLEISRRIAAKMKNSSSVIDCEMAVADMLGIIGECSIVCGMRLHALIFASVMNVPMVGIAYDPKIKGFMEYMNQENYVPLESFNGERFSKLAIDCLENLDSIKERLKTESAPLRKKAKQNAHMAIELINS